MNAMNAKNPKTAGNCFIQGDVAGKYISELPAGATPSKNNIIALGEVTGHSHVVEGAQKYTLGNQVFVVVEEEAVLLHNKHAPWTLRAGVIAFTDQRGVMQREYLGDEERRVID